MNKNTMIKKLVVYDQLYEKLIDIINNDISEFSFYLEENKNATFDDYINELEQIIKEQPENKKIIEDIQKYYECTIKEAILLYKFTNAYQLLNKNKE